MKSLFFSYDMSCEKAYIIRVKGNKSSEDHAATCAKSCERIGMPYEFWDAFNGLVNPIQEPDHLAGAQMTKMLKVTDHYLTRGEVACALSHISLWAKCVELDRPIVILEHDSVMIKKYEAHAVYNSICYLGGNEQAEQGWAVLPTPPHASEGPNYHFICRAHSYAIDPAVAKNMLAHAIKYGICAPLDIMLRADIFPIHQMGIYAYDAKRDKSDTTILARPFEGRKTDRNDKLEV
jgi:hypothetical protein